MVFYLSEEFDVVFDKINLSDRVEVIKKTNDSIKFTFFEKNKKKLRLKGILEKDVKGIRIKTLALMPHPIFYGFIFFLLLVQLVNLFQIVWKLFTQESKFESLLISLFFLSFYFVMFWFYNLAVKNEFRNHLIRILNNTHDKPNYTS